MSDRRRSATRCNVLILACAMTVCLNQTGCRAPWNLSSLKLKKDDNSIDALADTKNIQGPLERLLKASRARTNPEVASLSPSEGQEEYQHAEKLFQDGQYKAAGKEFKRIAKKYKHSQIEEDALFMLAESRFERKRYSWAQDGYETLLKEFPSTRYMSKATRRLFSIARIWLGYPDVETSGDIQLVGHDEPGEEQSDPPPAKRPVLSARVPLVPNLWDRSRPVFDTQGRALEALKSIWQNDVTGPLADDALMLTATHYLRKENYEEADHILTILREQYPKSPHLENAFVLGSHVKLMAYQGPLYHEESLQASRQLKESALRLFPGVDRERLREELAKIEVARAKHEWENVVYWEKKGKPRAVAVYCREVIKKFPTSSYAALAREKLAVLNAPPLPKPKRRSFLPRIFSPSPDAKKLPPEEDSTGSTEESLGDDVIEEQPRDVPPTAEPQIAEPQIAEEEDTGRVRL